MKVLDGEGFRQGYLLDYGAGDLQPAMVGEHYISMHILLSECYIFSVLVVLIDSSASRS